MGTDAAWHGYAGHGLAVAAAAAVGGAATATGRGWDNRLVRRARRVSAAGATALVPYAAWFGFATVLAAEIARRNRRPHHQPIAR